MVATFDLSKVLISTSCGTVILVPIPQMLLQQSATPTAFKTRVVENVSIRGSVKLIPAQLLTFLAPGCEKLMVVRLTIIVPILLQISVQLDLTFFANEAFGMEHLFPNVDVLLIHGFPTFWSVASF